MCHVVSCRHCFSGMTTMLLWLLRPLVLGLLVLPTSSPLQLSSSSVMMKPCRLPGVPSFANPNRITTTLSAAKISAGVEEDSLVVTTVVVVGGGWAGFTAADALASLAAATSPEKPKPAVQIHLLDASPRGPGGLAGGWRTSRRQLPVEAGIHGFWREYRNTVDVMEHSIGLDLDQVLTPFTPSLLVSSSGRVALAPVLGNCTATTNQTITTTTTKDDIKDLFRTLEQMEWSNLQESFKDNNFTKQLAQLLPPPLDIALLAEFDPKSPLTPVDRLSALGLLGAWADFGQEDASSWYRYDTTSADTLFRLIAAVSPTLYAELVAPLLHVLPMAPGYDLSAAAALSCFHVFALQAPGAFDVRWCRTSITDAIFNPWVTRLKETNCVDIRGSARVTSITENNNNNNKNKKKYTVTVNSNDQIQCDAVILAVGATAAGRLIDSCPPLLKLPKLRNQWKDWRGITCVTVRLFFRGNQLPTLLQLAMRGDSPPVTVCGPNLLPALIETGFCIYDLGRLQDANPLVQNAVEVDYFGADRLADESNSDEQIIELTLRAMEVALGLPPQSLVNQPDILQDSAVVRARRAVSHFDVGSASRSPPIRLTSGLYACGDWVDRTGHASWSTEKAVVTGRQAAAAVARDFQLGRDDIAAVKVIPAAPDTPTLTALRRVARFVRMVAPPNSLPKVSSSRDW